MQRRNQGGQVRSRLMEAVIFSVLRARVRHSDDRIDDAVTDLVGDDIEIHAERLDASVRHFVHADLEEAVTHKRVFHKVALQHELKPVEVGCEMPLDRMAEIFFPDIERVAYSAEQMRGLELWRVWRYVVEMSVGVRLGRRKNRTRPRWHQVEWRAAKIIGQT